MRRLLIGDKSVRVRDEGEHATRPPVMLVHGAGMSSVVWMDVVKRVAPRRRVVALDLPGHGQSDPWHGGSVDAHRDAVGTVAANLGLKKVVLVGHSLGAAIAVRCAVEWPERVAALVLVGAAPRFEVAPELHELLRSDFAHAAERLAPLQFSPATSREIVERWTAVTISAPDEIVREDYRAVDGYDLAPHLPRVKMPTLVVAGADDLLTPPRRAQQLAAGITNARAAILQHTGHMCFLEQPSAFHAILDPFLAEAAS